jgi:ribosomal protein S27AE
MNKVKVFGRRGSTYRKTIDDWMGNNRIRESHLAVNYGLQGEKLDSYLERNPGIHGMPVFNMKQAGNKFDQVVTASDAGVCAPNSWREGNLIQAEDVEKFIVKPNYSLGGRDINVWDGEPIADNMYLQDRVMNRRYEIRVHAFAWVDPEKWLFQKRVHPDGDDVLAWNFHNGGKFITIEDPHDPLHNRIRESVKTCMKALGYSFGGADFIIQNPGNRGEELKHYFIEWNLAPGWTLENTEEYYKSSFLLLQDIEMDMVDAILEGIYPWEWERDQDGPPPVEWAEHAALHDVEAGINVDNAPRLFHDDIVPVPNPNRAWVPPERQMEFNEIEPPPDAPNPYLRAREGQDAAQRLNEMREVARMARDMELNPIAPAVQFCPRCGSAQAAMAHVQDLRFCYQCGLNLITG